ncbi:alpha/beta hydrolase [Candidatus Binatia bacterium]|jgi:pimeloyl-ACP methyl ester carboxylesterase|nr:alpha/beta hydrolase [Candidatus Binatia bacterium]
MAATVRIPVNGVSLAVTDHGSACAYPARALVLAHATGFCGAVWQPLIPALRDRFRVITLDQRGHGDSDKPDTAYAWRDFVDDLAGVIDALDLRDVCAVGHSKGGAAVAGVAALHPGRIGRAVLLDPVLIDPLPEGRDPAGNLLSIGARRRRHVWDSRVQMVESLASRPPFDAWRRDFVVAYVDGGTFVRPDGRVELKCPGEIEARVYDGAARSSSIEFLAGITIPTLLVSGGTSLTLPPARARQAVALLRDGRLEILPGVGHFVPMEAPDEVLRLLGAFLQ